MSAGYRARWRGVEHPASPEPRPGGLWVRLRRDTPAGGFEEAAPGVFVRVVPVADVEVLTHVTPVCVWRGVPCRVHEDRGGRLVLEYAGGSTPEARALGMRRVARGVHRVEVGRDEVRGLREDTVVLTTG